MCLDSGLPNDWFNFLLGLADLKSTMLRKGTSVIFFVQDNAFFGAFVLMNWNKR